MLLLLARNVEDGPLLYSGYQLVGAHLIAGGLQISLGTTGPWVLPQVEGLSLCPEPRFCWALLGCSHHTELRKPSQDPSDRYNSLKSLPQVALMELSHKGWWPQPTAQALIMIPAFLAGQDAQGQLKFSSRGATQRS